MVKFWKDCISREIGEMDKTKSLVLFPIGAVERHGRHLPVGTDSIILETLLKTFVKEKDFDDYNVLVGPQLFIGKSNEHMNFPGTLTYTAHTLYDMIDETIGSMNAHGFRKFLLTNSHGGNTDLLNLISRDLRIKYDIEIYVFDWWFTDFWAELNKTLKESESPYGIFHACELETSLMMYIAPELVDETAISDDTPDEMFSGNEYVTLFGPVNMGWKTKDVTKSGVIGSPSFASREKGEKMLRYAVDKLEKILGEIIRFHY